MTLQPFTWLAVATLAFGTAAAAGQDGAARGDESHRLQARALVVADREASLTSDGPLKILEMKVDLGDRFAKGDTLIRFDCGLRDARVMAAEGASKGAQAKLQSKQRLVQLGTTGPLEAELAAAEAQKARGDLAEARDAAARCVVVAPYSGRVAKRQGNEHEVAAADKPLLSIVSDGPLRITTLVPSVWLSWLKPGSRFDIAVDEAGKTYQAEVVAIAGKADPASQTVELLGRVVGNADGLLPGMSGAALFSPPAKANP